MTCNASVLHRELEIIFFHQGARGCRAKVVLINPSKHDTLLAKSCFTSIHDISCSLMKKFYFEFAVQDRCVASHRCRRKLAFINPSKHDTLFAKSCFLSIHDISCSLMKKKYFEFAVQLRCVCKSRCYECS